MYEVKTYIGIDLGGTFIKYGISREDFRRAWRTGMWFKYRGAGGGGRRDEQWKKTDKAS